MRGDTCTGNECHTGRSGRKRTTDASIGTFLYFNSRQQTFASYIAPGDDSARRGIDLLKLYSGVIYILICVVSSVTKSGISYNSHMP